jgi:hypothetical protein
MVGLLYAALGGLDTVIGFPFCAFTIAVGIDVTGFLRAVFLTAADLPVFAVVFFFLAGICFLLLR